MLIGGWAHADTLTVAVASNFTAPMNDIAAAFEQATGHTVQLAFGSSGKFFAQIRNGAPFEVFFSADQAKPRALEEQGSIVPGSRFTYAVGALALWSSREDVPVDNAEVLRRGNFNKLALANLRLAPYGAAAVEVLDALELTEATRPHWVQGENIAQTYQFVRTGNAAVGFVALSQVMSDGAVRHGSAWIVPGHLHPPIRQDVVLLPRGEGNEAARAFLDYVRGESARAIIESYGYTVPASP
ncbi:molybdate-binding periplasmic protein ModA [Saccharospirillum salsuginis]|uniref:Molybdate-binding protein ModA n=2 Tax=Saccharospirillum salsuginis TaxID=418750 RepID=A0A918K599_9GAMM|nr:molybdate-binding periplasmic protein ModA [Saccharospirillum salsuginis]